MGTFITDDVEVLLKLKKGDSERLNRIKNLCDNKKLIPISDRKYVERLASQYLEKHVVTSSNNIQSKNLEEPQIHAEYEPQEVEKFEDVNNEFKETAKVSDSPTSKMTSSKSFRLGSKKIVFSFASIILAIVVIAIVSNNADFTSFVENTNQPTSSSNLIPPYIILVTDDKAYQKADIISVSGETNPVIQGKIRVTVENTQGKVIWAENVQVKDNGEFSTLLIGGGQGWEKNGQYALIAKHDTLETKTLFDFS
jgi:hypothetical protein